MPDTRRRNREREREGEGGEGNLNRGCRGEGRDEEDIKNGINYGIRQGDWRRDHLGICAV